MNEDEQRAGLLEEYLGIGRRPLYILLAIVSLVFVATTGIFISVFGFRHWKKNMNRAGAAMVINYDPQAAPVAPAACVCPSCGTVPVQPGTNGSAPICPYCGMQTSVK